MIAKRIKAKPQNDNYGQLGKYIADASHEGEKLLVAWHAGCLSETYETALMEIQATQAMNTRCKGGEDLSPRRKFSTRRRSETNACSVPGY